MREHINKRRGQNNQNNEDPLNNTDEEQRGNANPVRNTIAMSQASIATDVQTINMSQTDEVETLNFNRNMFNSRPPGGNNDLSFANAQAQRKNMTIDYTKIENKIEEKSCRICLCAEDDPVDNPIICPCSCQGSIKYIHYECIREWLEGKKHKKETPFVNSYIWRGLECEICKAFYRDVVDHPITGKELSLLMFDIHDDAYQHMIIESVTNSSSKTIHVVNFSRSSEIMVGRGSQCEVRITDVSVSRHHSTFEVHHMPDKTQPSGWNVVLSVRDEMSKFGTLTFLQRPIPIKNGKKICLQVGRSIFQF